MKTLLSSIRTFCLLLALSLSSVTYGQITLDQLPEKVWHTQKTFNPTSNSEETVYLYKTGDCAILVCPKTKEILIPAAKNWNFFNKESNIENGRIELYHTNPDKDKNAQPYFTYQRNDISAEILGKELCCITKNNDKIIDLILNGQNVYLRFCMEMMGGFNFSMIKFVIPSIPTSKQ